MNGNDAVSSLIITIFVATWLIIEAVSPVEISKADVIECVKEVKSQDGKSRCVAQGVTASWTVSINKSAGTCAMLFRTAGDDDSFLIFSGSSLAFVSHENWRCVAGDKGVGRLAS